MLNSLLNSHYYYLLMLMSVDLVECATYVSTRAQRVTSYFKAYP
jgi:hypothetical protein